MGKSAHIPAINPVAILFTANPCWNRILSYLPLSDIESLAKSHSRLKEIVKSYLREGNALLIDQETLWRYPIESNDNVYSKYGSLATTMEVTGFRNRSLLLLMPFFPKVQTLTVRRVYSGLYLKGSYEHNPSPLPGVRKLTLIGYSEEEKRDLSPSETKEPLALPYMSSLQSLTLIRCTINESWWNQDRMRSLGLSGQFRYTRDLMRVVSGMRNLRKLSLDCYFIHSAALDIPRGALPLLEELSITIDYNQDGKVMTEFLGALDLAQLKSFRICGRQCRSQVVWHRMVNLVELEVDSVEFFELVSDVFVFTNLEKLRAPFKDDRVLDLVKGLPKMTVLDNSSPKVGDTVAIKVLEYLRQSKRQLLLNGYRME